MNKQEKIQKEIDKTKKRAEQHYKRNKTSMEKINVNEIKSKKSDSQ